jgi:DNA (cytosine-5)-methyltransferase 1
MTIPLSRVPTIAAVDLFCGAGGLTYGLMLGGIAVRAGYDLDPSCRFPFEANNAAKFHERDVKDLTAAEVTPHLQGADLTLLTGCAPCQPFSTYSRSGRSKVRFDDWQLVSSFGRLVKEVRPNLVSMENVVQLADHSVFQDFVDCLAGYHVHWRMVECVDLGVPQSRRRLVLVASNLGEIELELPAMATQARTVRDEIYDLPAIRSGEVDRRDCLHTSSSLSPLNLKRIRASRPGGTWRDWDPSLHAECHRKESGATYPSVYGRMEWDKPAPTITTQFFGYGNGRFGHPEQDRAISLREAAMLQTFPRTYKFVPPGEPVRFNKLGRLIGNAVPVRLGEFIAGALTRHVTHLSR